MWVFRCAHVANNTNTSLAGQRWAARRWPHAPGRAPLAGRLHFHYNSLWRCFMARSDRIFKTRRSLKPVLVFIAVFGLFLIIGVVAMLAGEDTVGLGFLVFGGVSVFIMLMQIITPGSFYRLDPDMLILKRTFSTRLVPLDEISGVGLLSEADTKSVIQEYMAPAMAAESSMDLKNWYKSNKKYGHFIRYSTVPIVQSKTTAGSTLNITSFDAKTSGKFVILRLGSGEELLLSPTEPENLAAKLSSGTGKSMNLSGPYSFRGSSEQLTPRRPNRRKMILTINLISFFVIAAAVVIYFFVSR